MNALCLVLWRKTNMDKYKPTDPPAKASLKRLFSGTRLLERLAARLSKPAITKVMRFMTAK